MKIFCLFTLILSCITSAYCQENVFNIQGSIPKFRNDTAVILSLYEGNNFIKADTTNIKDHSFSFIGNEFLTGTAVLSTTDDNDPLYIEFILEGGKLSIALDTALTSTIIGKELNLKFDEYKKRMFNLPKVNEIVLENIDNPIGLIILQKVIHLLDDKTLYKIFSIKGEDFKEHRLIAEGLKRKKELFDTESERQKSKGTNFPDLLVKNSLGVENLLSNYVSKDGYTYIKFWSSWCGPCIIEIPEMQELCNKYNSLKFIAISIDDNMDDWLHAINKHHMPETNLIAVDVKKSLTLYHFTMIPYGILIDKNGKIAEVSTGGEDVISVLKKQSLTTK